MRAAWSRAPARSSCTGCGSWRWGTGRQGAAVLARALGSLGGFWGAGGLPLSLLCQAGAELNVSLAEPL